MLKKQNDTDFTDILNRFLLDKKGKLCQTNNFIITFGRYLFKKKQKTRQYSTGHNGRVTKMFAVFGVLYYYKSINCSFDIHEWLSLTKAHTLCFGKFLIKQNFVLISQKQ